MRGTYVVEQDVLIMNDLKIFANNNALIQGAADLFVELANTTPGIFTVALAGGSTPLPIYKLLASDLYASRINWNRTHIFFGDERCVPPTHEDSNYKAVQTAFLSHVPIPLENVHRMKGELSPEDGAKDYGLMLQKFFDGGAPAFDLHFLGMGDDGHTASLFPGMTAALTEKKHRVVATDSAKHIHPRLTMTAWAINAAKMIIVLVSGKKKADMLHTFLHGHHQPEQYPIQLIKPINGQLHWFVDQDAASRL